MSPARRPRAPEEDARVEGRLVLRIADEDVEPIADLVAQLLLAAWVREERDPAAQGGAS